MQREVPADPQPLPIREISVAAGDAGALAGDLGPATVVFGEATTARQTEIIWPPASEAGGCDAPEGRLIVVHTEIRNPGGAVRGHLVSTVPETAADHPSVVAWGSDGELGFEDYYVDLQCASTRVWEHEWYADGIFEGESPFTEEELRSWFGSRVEANMLYELCTPSILENNEAGPYGMISCRVWMLSADEIPDEAIELEAFGDSPSRDLAQGRTGLTLRSCGVDEQSQSDRGLCAYRLQQVWGWAPQREDQLGVVAFAVDGEGEPIADAMQPAALWLRSVMSTPAADLDEAFRRMIVSDQFQVLLSDAEYESVRLDWARLIHERYSAPEAAAFADELIRDLEREVSDLPAFYPQPEVIRVTREMQTGDLACVSRDSESEACVFSWTPDGHLVGGTAEQTFRCEDRQCRVDDQTMHNPLRSPDGSRQWDGAFSFQGEHTLFFSSPLHHSCFSDRVCYAYFNCESVPWDRLIDAPDGRAERRSEVPVDVPSESVPNRRPHYPCATDQGVGGSDGFVGWIDDEHVLMASRERLFRVSVPTGHGEEITPAQVPDFLLMQAGITADRRYRYFAVRRDSGYLWRHDYSDGDVAVLSGEITRHTRGVWTSIEELTFRYTHGLRVLPSPDGRSIAVVDATQIGAVLRFD